MKKRVVLAFLLVLLVSLAGCSVQVTTPSGYGSLSGYVYIPANSRYTGLSVDDALISSQGMAPDGYEPLEHAEVWISGKTNYIYYTDGNGLFFIPEVASGWRTINVRHDELRNTLKATVQVRANVRNVLDKWLYAGIGYYVIIGISDYQYLEDIPGPRQDALLVSETLFRDNYLAGIGYKLIDSQATKSAIRSRIQSIVSFTDNTKDDYLVIYFAGLSGLDYISPYDADGERWSTEITDVDLESWLSAFPGDVTVIIDGSESGTMADGKPFRSLALGTKQKYTVIASAGKDENTIYDKNFGHSVFTYFLAKGLERDQHGRARADTNGDGDITATELYDYIYDEMRWYYNNWRDHESHRPYIKKGTSANNVLFRY